MSGYTTRLPKVGLFVGYVALVGALFVAHGHPANGYELSILRGTPESVWVGLGVAFTVGTVVVLAAPRRSRVHDAAALLVASCAVTLVAMPVVRGYFFYGAGDSLSHVGWAREMAAGELSPWNLLYPGIHTSTVLVGSAGDVPLTLANLYLVLVGFPLVTLLTYPLLVQLLAPARRAYAVGVLTAVLFAPINNVSVHLIAHPASQGILFLPFVLYLALAYAARPRWWHTESPDGWRSLVPRLGGVTGVGALLAVASVGLLFVHPQQALNLALCLVAVTGFQVLTRLGFARRFVAGYRLLHVQTAVVVAAFLAWAPRFSRVRSAVSSTVLSLLTEGASAGDVVASKSVSVAALGGSVSELFVKLFLAATVLSVFAAAGVLLALAGRLADREADTLATYLAAAIVPVFGVFLVVLAGGAGDMYFRYQGFIMVPVAVLGAVTLTLALDAPDVDRLRTVGPAVLVVLFLVLVPMSAVALHPTPYIYQPSPHVTEAQTSGYVSSFEHRQPGVAFAGVRGGPRRFVDYHYGTQQARMTLAFPGYESPIPEPVFARANYTDYYENPRYVAVTDATYEREVTLYDGFRFGRGGFEALERTPAVNRVRTSEGFTLYRVDAEGET